MGASAGGIPPIQRVLSALPENFPAAVFVVIHTAAESPGFLADILHRLSSLPVAYAVDGEPIKKSRVYVAPPDRHLLLEKGAIRVIAGPRENRHRPAIDPLFRSAARAYAARVVAVLFSGALDDGTAGLSAVTRHGGVTIVQDPREARFASMPQNALRNDSPRYVLPVRQIASKLLDVVGNGVPSRNGKHHSESKLNQEVKIAEIDMPAIEHNKPGAPSAYTCPECNGTLWEIKEGKILRFRCRVGHAYGAESLLAAKNEELETALWTALRTLEEKAALHRRLSEQASARKSSSVARHFRQTADEMHQQAQTMRRLLLERESPPVTEAAAG
jgi:two-component system chemotaxis response regulator CheB